MKRILRNRAALLLITLLTAVHLNGCLDESPTSPSLPADEAPVLPAPESLTFDFGFFDQGATMQRAAGKDNFVNAYLRVVVVNAVVHLVLTPPVAAFSLALHTPPSPQPDGSWVWVYTYVQGDEEARVRLRGMPLGGDRVAWELRLTALHEVPALDNALWFEGETGDDGDEGFFRFHDLYEDGGAPTGRIDWGADPDGDFLRFTDLENNVDDTLEYREIGSLGSLTFTDASDDAESWFVKWDESDGTGSLKAPDYNGGQEACWDTHQNDTECGVPTL